MLAIHPLLNGTLGGATALSLSQLLVSGRAVLSKGGDCDMRCLSELFCSTFCNPGCEKSRVQQGVPREG